MEAGSFVYVSHSVDGDVGAYRLDGEGRLEAIGRYEAGPVAMPIAVAPDGGRLCVATRGDAPTIASWERDRASGALRAVRRAAIASSLTYLSFDASGRYLLGASYGDDRIGLYRAAAVFDGDGRPQHVETVPRAHSIVSSGDGRHAYVASLSTDRVHGFALTDEDGGRFVRSGELDMAAGYGPRHMRFAPSGAVLYVLSELRGCVAACTRDAASGRLAIRHVSARPSVLDGLRDGFPRPNFSEPQPDPELLKTLVWAADIRVTPDGRFVFISERTSSRIVGFRVEEGGALAHAGSVETETRPRGFNIDPSGRFLIASGELSARLSVYAIESETGRLESVSRCDGGRGANWVEVV